MANDAPEKAPDKPQYLGHRERQRDKFLEQGPDALADYEIIELLLTLARPRIDCKPIAKALIQQFGNLPGVLAAHPGFSLVPVRTLAPALWGAQAGPAAESAVESSGQPPDPATAPAGPTTAPGAGPDPDVLDSLTGPDGRYLRLDPARHGTDGFFAAVLRRDT